MTTFAERLEFLLLEFNDDDPRDIAAALQAALNSIRDEGSDLREESP